MLRCQSCRRSSVVGLCPGILWCCYGFPTVGDVFGLRLHSKLMLHKDICAFVSLSYGSLQMASLFAYQVEAWFIPPKGQKGITSRKASAVPISEVSNRFSSPYLCTRTYYQHSVNLTRGKIARRGHLRISHLFNPLTTCTQNWNGKDSLLKTNKTHPICSLITWFTVDACNNKE